MRYDDREKPALAVMLNLLDWLGIFVAGGLAIVRSGYYTPPFPAPLIAWTEVVSTSFCGILLLGFAGIVRVLHRIEQAIGETRAALLTGLSVKVKTAPHTKESG